jgi:hypothetical protein
VGEQQPAGVGAVAGPDGDPRQPGDDGCLDGVLKKDRRIEISLSELTGKGEKPSEAGMPSRPLVDHDLVDGGVHPDQIGHPGLHENRDPCLRQRLAHSGDRRKGHDHIPDPVGPTNENVMNFFER